MGGASSAPQLGVHSEVGVLRTVLVHRPGLELERLTPRNKDDLLFDDVLWVKRARQEHDAFCDALAERGIQVLEVRHLLAETIEQEDVRSSAARSHHLGGRPGRAAGSRAAGVARRRCRRPSWRSG